MTASLNFRVRPEDVLKIGPGSLNHHLLGLTRFENE